MNGNQSERQAAEQELYRMQAEEELAVILRKVEAGTAEVIDAYRLRDLIKFIGG